MGCRISRRLLAEIIAEAAACEPLEACGLLFGTDAQIDRWQPAPNVAHSPNSRFEIDPGALIAALRAARIGGPQLAGYWHSHPGGSVEPSATDAASAAPDGRLWLIVAGDRAAAWRAGPRGTVHRRFDPVPLELFEET